MKLVDQVRTVSQTTADVSLTEVGTQKLVHTSEVCAHHRVCIFMRGLWSDLCLRQPLTQKYPTSYWLTSDVAEVDEPAAWRSDGQLVFHHSRNTLSPLLLSRKASAGKEKGLLLRSWRSDATAAERRHPAPEILTLSFFPHPCSVAKFTQDVRQFLQVQVFHVFLFMEARFFLPGTDVLKYSDTILFAGI